MSSKKCIKQKTALKPSHGKKVSSLSRFLPNITYPESLPITAKRKEIIEAIKKYKAVVITGETGSGKTTQIPKMCLEAGRGISGIIGCTQPRRVAAITVANRIAEELGEDIGRSVGYQIRFDDQSRHDNLIKIMTDGILLTEMQKDPYLHQYDTVIVDEAHERSLNIDFALGILRKILNKRSDLKVVITSATIDTEKFARAFDAPIIEVSGRMYPVSLRYVHIDQEFEELSDLSFAELAVMEAEKIIKAGIDGDILIFMPTEQDIRDTCEILEANFGRETTILPLFARLPWIEQRRVFEKSSSRKIIVATNIAETSITILGIRYVIDSGLARISQYNPRSRTTSLLVSPISKSSADQRKGRCGRVQNGVCIRLYSEEDFEKRPIYTKPEILRSNLAEVILRMLSLNLDDINSFPFIDPPNPKSLRDGIEILKELGAIETPQRGDQPTVESSYPLTPIGKMMARLPIDPRISRMIIEGKKEGCLTEILITSAALSIQDPRERPFELEAEADKKQAVFSDTDSDFMTLLRIWNHYKGLELSTNSKSRIKKFCKDHYLSFKRMREWTDVFNQLKAVLEEHGFKTKDNNSCLANLSLYDGIHKSIISGYLSNIAIKKEKNIFTAAKGKEVMIFPGSVLFNKAKNWIVAAEMIETSRLYARTVANIKSEWLEEIGGKLCRSTYSEPHWSRERGEVIAYEQVRLFDLVIIPKRPVSYGRINSDEASEIFIQSALIEKDITKPFPFLMHNERIIEKVSDIENKLRRRNLFSLEEKVANFYRTRIHGINNIRSLNKMIKEKGGDNFLRMTEEDILQNFSLTDEVALYPDEINIGDHKYHCFYKFDPGKHDDGATLKIPLHMLSFVSEKSADRLIPGLLKEKILALLKSLPKEFKNRLKPLSKSCEIILEEIASGDDHLLNALRKTIYDRFGLDIPAIYWRQDIIPDHLLLRYSIVAENGNEISAGRDIKSLQKEITSEITSTAFSSAREKWEKTGLKEWNFDSLPEVISLGIGNVAEGLAYPALEAGNGFVNIRLFQNKSDAEASHKKGVAELYCIFFKNELKYFKKCIALTGELKELTNAVGITKLIENSIYQKVVEHLFERPFRIREDFYRHAEEISSKIVPSGLEIINSSKHLIKAYIEAVSRLWSLEKANRSNQLALKYIFEIKEDLNHLMPRDSLLLHFDEKKGDIIRYLKAMVIRAERGLLHLEKAFQKTEKVKTFVAEFEKIYNSASHMSQEKKQALDELKWMIEEYKISLFAQEIKTAIPISEKRLKKKIQEIENLL